MRLRPATMRDANFLLELKNDSVARAFSVLTQDEIKKEDHEKWLAEHLDEISIAQDVGHFVGMLRVSKDLEVSINVRAVARGQGYGQMILEDCPKGVWAKIVNGNVASMRLFLGAGFKITGYENNYYILRNDP